MGWDPIEAPLPEGQKHSLPAAATLLDCSQWEHRAEETIFCCGGGRGAFWTIHSFINRKGTLRCHWGPWPQLGRLLGDSLPLCRDLTWVLHLICCSTMAWQMPPVHCCYSTLWETILLFFFSVLQIAFLKALERTWERKDQLTISEMLFWAQSSKLLLKLETASPTAKIQGASVGI